MMPEWSLHIFMEKFDMSKEKAIAQLQKQENTEISKQVELYLLE